MKNCATNNSCTTCSGANDRVRPRILFSCATRPESLPQVVERIRAGINKIRSEGIPADEFEKAKAKLIVSHAMRNTTPVERAFQSSLDELYGLGYDFEKKYAERIGKVKIDDVVGVVKKYFDHGVVVTSSTDQGGRTAKCDEEPKTKAEE